MLVFKYIFYGVDLHYAIFPENGRDFLDLPQTPEIRIEHPLQMALFRDFTTLPRECKALENLNADTASPFIAALSADNINTRGREAIVL